MKKNEKVQSQKKILLTWIGFSDIKAMNSWRIKEGLEVSHYYQNKEKDRNYLEPHPEVKGENGPARTLIDSVEVDEVYALLSKEYELDEPEILQWISRGSKANCYTIRTGLQDPTSYEDIFNVSEAFFDKYWTSENSQNFIYNLTPGTPAMQAIMLYLASVKYSGGLIYKVVDPRHAQDGIQHIQVKLPFQLSFANFKNTNISYFKTDDLENIYNIYAPIKAINILLLGESGVGKSSFAKDIHDKCGGDAKKFITANCAELSSGDGSLFRSELFGAKKGSYTGAVSDVEGAFAKAQGGTLFLDEIGEIPLHLQSVLLRAIQEKEIQRVGDSSPIKIKDVRIIAATNKNLVEEVRAGRFRADLYYRIAMCVVPMPSLRDIILSNVDKFKEKVKVILNDLHKEIPELEYGFDIADKAWDLLLVYKWPGNIRELRRVLLLACVLANSKKSEEIKPSDIRTHLHSLPDVSVNSTNSNIVEDLPSNLDGWIESKYSGFVKEAMRRCNGKKADAARLLGITYQKIDYALKVNK